jgi:hypothetical protein
MPLTLRVLLGLILGLATGAGLAAAGYAHLDQVIAVAEPVGGLWLDALRMTIVPLVFSLIVTGMVQAQGAARAGGPAARALILFAALLLSAAVFSALVMPAVLAIWPAAGPGAGGGGVGGRDMTEITHVDVDPDDDPETNEAAYAELVEFVRVGVQLLYEHLQPLRQPLPAGARETLH